MKSREAFLRSKPRPTGNATARKFISIIVFLLFILLPFDNIAQNEPEFDEISVFLNVQRIGGTEIQAVIKGQELFLPVTDLFDFLKIRNIVSPDLDSITGFFINSQDGYIIDRVNHRIEFQGKVYDIRPDGIILTESNLFLHSSYFGQEFGLDCSFDFRSLSVNLLTNLELPIIREMRQEQMRKNLSNLTGERQVDTTIGRSSLFFHFGMADWSVISTQRLQDNVNTRVSLGLGGIFVWGETNIVLYYNSGEPFTSRQQYYLWRYVNNENRFLRQSLVGKIPIESVATLFAPVVGVAFTNTPTTFRRSFGTYTLSDHTQPGWIVELYVNNVLVNYVKADASGFFSFEVPLVYGNSSVRLRFYGPWGEQLVKDENIIIPFNFLPKNQLEYRVSAGMVEDGHNSMFSHANVDYGLTRSLTIGGGAEYLSSVTSGTVMPFANLSVRLFPSLLFWGKYTYGVGSQAILTYRRPSNLLFELNYTRFDVGQTAVNFYYLENRKAVVSIPVRGKKYAAFTRLTFDHYVMPVSNYATAEWLISASFLGINANLTTFGMFIQEVDPNVYSNLAVSLRLPLGFVLTPQAQFDYNKAAFISVRMGLERRVFRNGYANLTYEENFRSDLQIVQLGLRYDFSFAQTGFSFWNTNQSTTLVESARGSLMFDSKTNFIGTSNRNSVGRGGMAITPFLDLNWNGSRDAGEPKVSGMDVRVSGGRIQKNDRDTTIRVFDLEPYTDYIVELDKNSFDNAAWQMKTQTIRVAIEPNQFRHIGVPVTVAGEVSGTVYNEGQNGQGRIIVSVFNTEGALVARTLSEEGGYFSYLGLKPGEFTVKIDPDQLSKLHLHATPESIIIKVRENLEGDIIDGLEFRLNSILSDTLSYSSPVGEKTEIVNDINIDNQIIENDKSSLNLNSGQGNFAIQFGAFQQQYNAISLQVKLRAIFEYPSEIILEENLYKVLIMGIENRKKARKILDEARKKGFKNAFVISL